MALGCVTGCGTTLPDLGPYTSATQQLRDGVAAGGRATEQQLDLLGDMDLTAEQKKAVRERANTLRTSWAKRVKAMDAVVEYSAALEEITAAGETGSDAVGSVADSLGGLAEAAGVAMPQGGAVGAVTDVVKFVYAQLALVRAARALDASLEAAQPAVERLSKVLDEDLQKLSEAAVAALAIQRNVVREQLQVEIYYRNRLLERRKALYSSISARTAPHPVGEKDAEVEELELNGRLLEQAEAWHAPLQARLTAIAERRDAVTTLIAAARAGLARWNDAHAALAAAVEEERKRGPNVQSMIASASEVKDLIERIRER